MLRKLLLSCTVLAMLGGCASVTRTPAPSEPQGPGTSATAASPYEPERDAATIAQMRAAPPPASPELASGTSAAGDANRLSAQGFVRIGSAHYTDDESAVRSEAVQQGRVVGAERVLLYPPAADGRWLAAYYVRFKLPFGATFRDLKTAEREAVGGVGGVEIGAVVGGTPAALANLLAGDIVIEVDGKPIADKAAFQNLLRASTGRAVTLTLVRGGETLRRVVRLGAMTSGGDGR